MSNPFGYEDSNPDDFWGDVNPYEDDPDIYQDETTGDDGYSPLLGMSQDDYSFGELTRRMGDLAPGEFAQRMTLGESRRESQQPELPGMPKKPPSGYPSREYYGEFGSEGREREFPSDEWETKTQTLLGAQWEVFNAERELDQHVNEQAQPLINEAFTPTLFDQPDLKNLQYKRMFDPRLED